MTDRDLAPVRRDRPARLVDADPETFSDYSLSLPWLFHRLEQAHPMGWCRIWNDDRRLQLAKVGQNLATFLIGPGP